jgi:hypothetical protein
MPQVFGLAIAGNAVVYPQLGQALTCSSLDLGSGGQLTHLNGQQLRVNVLEDAVVQATGQITASALGYPIDGIAGPGAGSFGGDTGSGGGYGGSGGHGYEGQNGGSPNGSAEAPLDWGSAGGAGESGRRTAGGGVIHLNVAGTLTVDGSINANGQDSFDNDQGGGSGGSVWLNLGLLAGTGSITANGGSGQGSDGGGGGGGRVAIYHNGMGLGLVSVTASGGSGHAAGGTGTVFTGNSLTSELPVVLAMSPVGTVARRVAAAEVTFNVTMNDTTFTPADVLITTPSGSIPTADITVTPLSAAGFSITFPPQTTVGSYQIQIGPHLENLYGQEMAAAYTGGFTIANPVISGFVRMADGTPVANVQLSTDTGLAASTGSDGAYSLAVPPAWSGTVTPQTAGWVTTPTSRTYLDLTTDSAGENFSMDLAQTAVFSLTRTNDTLYFSWPSAVGLTYQLQSSTSLLPDSWTDEGTPIPGTGAQLTTNLLIGTEPEKFFRLKIDN